MTDFITTIFSRRLGLVLAAVLVYSGCATPRPTAETPPAPADTAGVTATPRVPERIPERTERVPPGAEDDEQLQAGRFDSGKMWTFEYPPMEYFREEYDFAPDSAWFEQARLGSLRLPNCTASFVSPNGLVMTNHHCARSGATSVSRSGENILDDGFYASSIDGERRIDGLYVDQVIRITDVTSEMYAAMEGHTTDDARARAREAESRRLRDRLTAEAGGAAAGIEVQIVELFDGGLYSAYTFRRYSDIRLVMIPELKLGAFGGDPDNFTYPRYSLDMAFLRVYENGRPFNTDHYFGWSEDGASPEEPVFVVGNPGATSRLQTVAEFDYRRDLQEQTILNFYENRLRALQAYRGTGLPPEEDAAIRNQISSLQNAQKLFIGRVETLHDPVVRARRLDAERQFRQAIDQDPALRAEHSALHQRMEEILAEKRRFSSEFAVFLALQPVSTLSAATLRRAVLAHSYLSAQLIGAESDRLGALREQLLSVPDQSEGTDIHYLAGRLQLFIDTFGRDSEMVQQMLDGRAPEAAAEQIVRQSALSTSGGTRQALEGGTLSFDDPAIEMVDAFMPVYQDYQQVFARLSAEQQDVARRLGRARFEIFGTDIPPDATFSLRLSDGVVRGYPFNGTIAPPYTTIWGIYDHYYSYGAGTDWDLPSRWLDPPAAFDLSTPVNLVSTNDIIGGNSGSPLLNRDLEVVGLVFDGNIESLAGDFIYLTDRNRAISVDSRGIREVLDVMYDADRIVLELTTGRMVPTEAEADAILQD